MILSAIRYAINGYYDLCHPSPSEVEKDRALQIEKYKALKIMQDHLHRICKDIRKRYDILIMDRGPGTDALQRRERADNRLVHDVSRCILNFKKVTHLTPAALQELSAQGRKDWSLLRFPDARKSPPLDPDYMEAAVEMSVDEFKEIFLSGRIGMTLAYFERFDRTGDINSSFFCPLHSVSVRPKEGVEILRLDYVHLDKADLDKKIESARFLQAAIKSAILAAETSIKPEGGLKNILLTKMYGNLQNTSKGFCVDDLVSVLKKVIDQQGPNSYHLLSIYSPTEEKEHVIGLHLRAPFHFVDIKQGIESADTIYDFILLLSIALTERYLDFTRFMVREFVFSTPSSSELSDDSSEENLPKSAAVRC